ncbi:MAG: heavy metal sensor histidine kinase [Verrucomicrobiota bacterium]
MPMQNSRWPISYVLTLFYALSAFIILFLATAFLYWGMDRELEVEKHQSLVDQLEVIRVIIKEKPAEIETLKMEVDLEGAARRFAKFYARVLDQNQNVLMESANMNQLFLAPSVFPPPVPFSEKPELGTRWKSPEGKWFLLMSAWADSEHPRLLELALDITPEETVLAKYRVKLLLVLVMGILCSAAVGILISRRGMKPLAEIAEAAQKMNAAQLHARIVPEKWPRELMALATAFDGMLARLENSFSRLSQFSADVAHEFRTPIASLRLQAEVALNRSRTIDEYRTILESSLEEFERLSRMIDSLLFLARAENAETVLHPSRFASAKEIKIVMDYYEAMAAEKKVTLDLEGDGEIEGDSVLFQRAISNLLANAIRHTPPGGKITVLIRSQNGETQIQVTDTGCGLDPEHLPKVFDRFYRVDKSRDSEQGTGLGLAIVKSILELHGGKVEIQSQIGQRTTVILKFPARSPS